MTDSVLAAIEHVCDVIEHDFDVNVSDCVVAAVEHAVVVATAATLGVAHWDELTRNLSMLSKVMDAAALRTRVIAAFSLFALLLSVVYGRTFTATRCT